jgi:hypothetical protein
VAHSRREPSLFSPAERFGISLAVVLLFGNVAMLMAFAGESMPFPEVIAYILSFLPRPVVEISFVLVPIFGTLALGIDCFCRFRRDPIVATRILWLLAILTFLLLGFVAPSFNIDSLHSALGRFAVHLEYGQILLRLTNPPVFYLAVIGLLFVFLAGELSHQGHLRLLREQLAEAIDYTAREHDRVLRRQRLILTVRGATGQIYAVVSRFLVLMIMPTLAAYWIAKLQSADFENALRAPAFGEWETVTTPNLPWIVSIDEIGAVHLNDFVVAKPGDQSCDVLRERLLAGAGLNYMRVALFIQPGVKMERFIDVLNACERVGANTVIVEGSQPR